MSENRLRLPLRPVEKKSKLSRYDKAVNELEKQWRVFTPLSLKMRFDRAVFVKVSSKGFSGVLKVGTRVYYPEADLNGVIVKEAVGVSLLRPSFQFS